jgi:hypothetical protein
VALRCKPLRMRSTKLPSGLLLTVLFAVLGGCAEQDPSGRPTATGTSSTSSAPEGPLALTNSCTSPEGFGVSYPRAWFTNDGSVVPECSQFSPDQFQVPEGTDERVAPITIFIDPVPFFRAATPDLETEQSRAPTVLDGRQAVRIDSTAGEDGFYPEGTRQIRYLVDLSDGEEAGDDSQTLFLDTVGTANFDFETSAGVLDRMAQTLTITAGEEPQNATTAVARYGGGGGAFSVVAEEDSGEICFRIPPEGEPGCTAEPTIGDVEFLELTLVGPRSVLAGSAGSQVFRIEARQTDGGRLNFLPAPIGDGENRGWALTAGSSEVSELIWYSINGRELGRQAVDQEPGS